jgi:xanthine dehydrogenase accessory factor
MRDILADLNRWLGEGEAVALATVIQTWGSSPRRMGSRMGIAGDGRITGSVSGGCVEGAVVEAASEALQSGRGRLLHFGVADESAWEVGLACGGSIDVFVNPLNKALYDLINGAMEGGYPAAHLTVIAGPDSLIGQEALTSGERWDYTTLDASLAETALISARDALHAGHSCRIMLAKGVDAYIDVLLPAPVLIVVGGAHVSIALVSIAQTLGYRTVVVDPRRAFATEERFPHANELTHVWPDKALPQIGLNASTAVAVLTHDPKIDDPALIAALPSPAFYVGALGSRSTQAKRRQRLLDAGLTEAVLDRLRGPIGLDIGATTPEEIALSVMAEIVAARNRVPSPLTSLPRRGEGKLSPLPPAVGEGAGG